MTVWWANHLTSKDALHVGQILLIPPVSGVVVTVAASDTLDKLAARYDVDAADIVDANNLDDPNLVVGQTLTIPGARAGGIATAEADDGAEARPHDHASGHAQRQRLESAGRRPSTPAGRFHWPVAGRLHQPVLPLRPLRARHRGRLRHEGDGRGGGTVIFAGWKNNGGGYQVWIAHGSNLYTTYNHMSSITVGRGQSVGRGQQVGRVGMTGNATGPHLHFEVWRGPIWDGGTRVNPLIYL